MSRALSKELKAVRAALADYMWAEGCSCCRKTDEWEEARARLGKLLHVSAYRDGSGHEFSKYRTEDFEK